MNTPGQHTLELQPTPLRARGTAGTWLTGMALIVCVAMIVGLLGLILVSGSRTFWQKPIEQVTLESGESFLGMRFRTEQSPDLGERTLYRVGNRDLGQQPFRWVDEQAIAQRAKPDEAVLVERYEWGIWLGVPSKLIEVDEGGNRTVVADGPRDVLEKLPQYLDEARARHDRADEIRSDEIAGINHRLEKLRLNELNARLRASQETSDNHLGLGLWFVVVAVGLSSIAGLYFLKSPQLRRVLVLVLALSAVGAFVERPWAGRPISQARLQEILAESAAKQAELTQEFSELTQRVAEIEAEDERYRIEIIDPLTGRMAALSQSQSGEPMKVSQIIRVVQPNDVGFGGKLGLYLKRWWEFVATYPREANTEGGVFPVIIGTLLVTLLLTVAVVPLGVMAALYMREYAKQGVMISILRVAINNLAGVPSIVYGVFGLGFFCYGVGGVIDGGPDPSIVLRAGQWWVLLLIAAGFAFVAMTLSSVGPRNKRGLLSGLAWGVVALLAVVAVFTTPYFEGFFRAKLLDGSPTFGTSGLLWASLTLALLTLPVVIVSAEEAIAAVPGSLREGSYGCGASKWQTIQRVVLPGAMPGILTGAILAMARGAGEVAPLMIVGAVKLAPQLPFEPRFPFLFADRSFMHLGFHIYDLGFKSPDSEAARGYVWTTTLLLVTLVVLMNLTAIRIRTKLKARFQSGQF